MDAQETAEASKVICLECGEPALPKCWSESGRREVLISRFCEPCWFAVQGLEPDPRDIPYEDEEEEDE